MAAHPESTRPQQSDETTVPRPIPLPAPEPAPVPDGNRLSRRGAGGVGGTPFGRAAKVQPGRRQGLVPNPRQYSTRRRG